jgi:short-subunit dehydrogenase
MITMNKKRVKTILITGARRGIGRDSAIALARRGHHVIATVHHEESVEDLRAYAKDRGVELDVFKLDITDGDDHKKLDDLHIDVLINNAGVGESGPLAEVPMERVRKNFETNVFGTLSLTQYMLRRMMERDSGTVLIISSINGRATMNFWGPYCMTKFSLSAAAEMMRKEIYKITKNVHVSVIEPGAYHTGFNQEIMAKKYEWLDERSFFFKMIDYLKKRDKWVFDLLEKRSTASIVRKIVQATEARRPRLRYVAPFSQSVILRIVRIFGR